MKKLISLVFCVALLFGLTACGSKIEDEALDALETSIANLLEMKSSTFHIDMMHRILRRNKQMQVYLRFMVLMI